MTETVGRDGRHKRSEASRERIVTAMLDLVSQGIATPGAEQVAEKADVGLRSVFRHFKDMEGLHREMVTRLAKQYFLLLVPFEAPTWQGQLDEMIERRITNFDLLLPFKNASDIHRHRSPSLQTEYERILDALRMRLHAILPKSIAEDEVVFESLDFILRFESWQRLRIYQKLTTELARRVWIQQVALITKNGEQTA